MKRLAELVSLVFDPRLEILVLLGLTVGVPVGKLAIVAMAALGLMMAIRWKWRVSAHAGVNSALATYVVMAEGDRWMWLYVVVVLVGWSRIRLKRHGLRQVIAGAVLGGGGVWLGMQI